MKKSGIKILSIAVLSTFLLAACDSEDDEKSNEGPVSATISSYKTAGLASLKNDSDADKVALYINSYLSDYNPHELDIYDKELIANGEPYVTYKKNCKEGSYEGQISYTSAIDSAINGTEEGDKISFKSFDHCLTDAGYYLNNTSDGNFNWSGYSKTYSDGTGFEILTGKYGNVNIYSSSKLSSLSIEITNLSAFSSYPAVGSVLNINIDGAHWEANVLPNGFDLKSPQKTIGFHGFTYL